MCKSESKKSISHIYYVYIVIKGYMSCKILFWHGFLERNFVYTMT